jgi:hypothetical protein
METQTLTAEAIDAMSAGRGMDALMAGRVMSYEWLDEVRERHFDPAGFGPTRWAGWVVPGTKNPVFDMMWRYETGLQQPEYSTDIAAAWQVVEYLKDKQGWFVLQYRQWDKDWYCGFFPPNPPHNTDVIAGTMPLAICRAALKASL